MTGDDLLFEACKKGKITTVNELIQPVLIFKLKPKADVNARDGEGFTPIFYAVRDGRRDIVRTLLARGADVHARGKKGQNLLQYAIDAGQTEIAKLLIARGAEADTRIIAFPVTQSPLTKLAKAAVTSHDGIVDEVSAFRREKRRAKTAKEIAGTGLFVAANAPLHEGVLSSDRTGRKADLLPIPIDPRLANMRDVNDFIFDERDRLMAGDRRGDNSTDIVWDLLKEYRLFRGRIVCDHDEKSRAILAYASSDEGGIPDMVGEICETQEGVMLVMGGDLRAVKDRWLDLVELLIRSRHELGIVEASFFDMLGETLIIIEPTHQHRLSNIGKALGGGNK